MKIAHVSAVFPPYSSGTGNVCFHNTKQLAALGHDVHVFSVTMRDVPELVKENGVTIHRLKPLLQIGNAPLLPQLLWQLRSFDIIHLHYPFIFGAELVRIATILKPIPMVITFHNDLVGDWDREHTVLFKRYQRMSARFTVHQVARICAVSSDHYQSSMLKKDLGSHEPVVVEIPNGVDTSHFTPDDSPSARGLYSIPDDARLALFVAALDRAHDFKGLDILLHAIQTLPDDVWLLVVGDGDLRERYESICRDLEIRHRVKFAGNIPNMDLPPYYRCANVTVLPSFPPESFGLVLVESLACGTPVIASDIPGVRTVVDVGRDGYLFKRGDAGDLAKKITDVLSSAQKSHAMGQAGRRKVVERYAWEKIGMRLDQLYREVVA